MSTCTQTPTAPTAAQLAENRQLLNRILLDTLIIILLLIPVAICEFVIEPFRRGFFCDDESISYPFRDNTVTPVMLGFLIAVPIFTIIPIGEYMRARNRGALNNTRYLWGRNIPIWITNCCKQLVLCFFGLLLTLDATELPKYTIGRLRPHFMAVCQPQFTDGTTCQDSFNQHRYVENYFCLGNGYTVADVRQARLSFPSGHSSMAFYAMVYCVLYLQQRMQWRRSALTRHFIQFTLIMIAWFTALSRIIDNWHHWSDVLVGSLIGVLVAIVTAKYISKLFQPLHGELVPLRLNTLPRQDTSATLNEVLASTPPPYVINGQAMQGFANDQYCTKV